MREIPAALEAHLQSGATTICWCWKVTRTDGTVFGFTNHDRPIEVDGTTYEASTGMLATEAQSSLGMSVDNMDVEGAIESDKITEEDILSGKFDDAEITVYLVNWSDTSQFMTLKTGNLGEFKRGKTAFVTEMRGLTARLQQEQGRTYNYTCDVDLGSTKCGIDLTSATYMGTGSVTSSDGVADIVTSGLSSYDNDWFSSGLITFTSGNNSGLSYEVRSHTVVGTEITLLLWVPAAFVIQDGDTFTVTAGCNKLAATCRDKFSNIANFRGFHLMPTSDQVLAYASQDDDNLDGGSIFNG